MAIKARVLTRFPARVIGGTGIAITTANGTYTIALNVPIPVDGVWSNTRISKTANYPVANTDKGRTFALSGNTFFTLTFGAASGFDANFMVKVVNEDNILASGRGKRIILNSGTDFVLYPGQSVDIWNSNSVWKDNRPTRWRPPNTATITFYTDFTNGTDSFSSTDGLGTGTAAFKTANFALYRAITLIDADGSSSGQTAVVVQMASNTTDTTAVHFSPHGDVVGSQGGFALTLQGNTASVLSVAADTAINVFFGRIRVKDLYLVSAGYGVAANFGAHIYLDDVKFRQCDAGAIAIFDHSSVELTSGIFFADAGATTTPYGVIAQRGGEFVDAGFNLDHLGDATYTTFFLAQSEGIISSSGVVQANGHTLAGKGSEADSGATVSHGALPGAFSASTTSGGGTINGECINFAPTGRVTAFSGTATPAGGTAATGFQLGSAGIMILWGSAAPTCAAPKGSMYLRTNGSGVNDRFYINTDGGTTWTAGVTVA